MPIVILGSLLCLLGLAALAGRAPFLEDYAYPIAWWGILLLADEWNWRRRGLSLWRGRARHFLLVTAPVSVLFWLFFEALNLASPQWRYRGGLPDVASQTLFGFVAFATVIPIEVEACWIVMGAFCLPEALASHFRRWKATYSALGLALLALPFFNLAFWFNQGMWIAPALLLLPMAAAPACGAKQRFPRGMILAGLLAGFFWEALNWRARTHWEYLILPGAPHLFAMPLPGYLGFIPFALTSLVVYEGQLHIPARPFVAALLYGAALALLYALTLVYLERGLWMAT